MFRIETSVLEGLLRDGPIDGVGLSDVQPYPNFTHAADAEA